MKKLVMIKWYNYKETVCSVMIDESPDLLITVGFLHKEDNRCVTISNSMICNREGGYRSEIIPKSYIIDMQELNIGNTFNNEL